MTRDELTNEAIELSKLHKSILLEFATSVGKTKASLEIVSRIGGKWLIAVAETAHKQTWTDDIIKHGFNSLLKDVEFTCYASLRKYSKHKYTGVILDEAHHVKTKTRLNALKSIKFDKCILLTATIKNEEREALEVAIGSIKVLKFNINNAIDSNILPTPKIVLIPLELDSFNSNQSFIMMKGKPNPNATIVTCNYTDRWLIMNRYSSLKLEVKCTELEKYNYLCEQIDYYKNKFYNSRFVSIKNKWLQCATTRKRFLSSIKTQHLKKLIYNYRGRVICFVGSIDQCNELGGKHVVHSKIKNVQKIIDKFNNREINRLFAVGMLKEGVNLVESNVIISQLDSGSRSAIQSIGRALRKTKSQPIIHILYFTNTQDETYLNNILPEIQEYIVNK